MEQIKGEVRRAVAELDLGDLIALLLFLGPVDEASSSAGTFQITWLSLA